MHRVSRGSCTTDILPFLLKIRSVKWFVSATVKRAEAPFVSWTGTAPVASQASHDERGAVNNLWFEIMSLICPQYTSFWIPDTTCRWQWLPKIVCRYGAVRSADDSVGSATWVPASIKLIPGIIIAHSAKQSCNIFGIQDAVYGVCCSTATCCSGSVGG